MNIRFNIFFLFIVFCNTVYCQTKNDSTLLYIPQQNTNSIPEYSFLKSLGQNFSEQAKAPFTMSKDQAFFFGTGVVITGTLIFFDQNIDNVVSPLSKKNSLVRNSSPHITEFGGAYGIIGSGVFGLYSIVCNDKKAQQTSLLLTEAMITSGAWVRVGKILFSRERPSAAYEFSRRRGGKWVGVNGFFAQRFESVAQHDAFPSGHTATVFAIATVFAEQYHDNDVVPIFAYTFATVVGVTRMIEHTHWASDVFVGGVIGYLCGKQVVHHYHTNYRSNEIETNLSIGTIGEVPVLTLFIKF